VKSLQSTARREENSANLPVQIPPNEEKSYESRRKVSEAMKPERNAVLCIG